MRRVIAALATATLTTGLLTVSLPASAVFSCPDPDGSAFGGSVITPDDVVLGPGDTAKVIFEMYENLGCLAAYPPSPKVVTAAGKVIPLAITSSVNNDAGYLIMRGTATIDASQLANADAGEWFFRFDAGHVEGRGSPVNVLRKTKLSFDAGPEPLRRSHRLTFQGTLRGADWQRGAYRGVRHQEVRIVALDGQPPGQLTPVAVTQTKRHGRYRVRAEVAGPNRFEAVFLGDFPSPLRSVDSRIDTVAARS